MIQSCADRINLDVLVRLLEGRKKCNRNFGIGCRCYIYGLNLPIVELFNAKAKIQRGLSAQSCCTRR